MGGLRFLRNRIAGLKISPFRWVAYKGGSKHCLPSGVTGVIVETEGSVRKMQKMGTFTLQKIEKRAPLI